MLPDNESDYEDDGYDFAGGDDGEELDDEALVWQLLLLINPGDEDSALQQFARYREAREENGDEREPAETVQEAIDWTSGFYVDWKDTASFVDVLDQLAARWNLRIEWGVEDPTDDEFLDRVDVPELMSIAYDRLREHGYTLWNYDTGGDAYAGWIALRRDDENMKAVATGLGIDVQPANEAF
ncbi:DUF6630 family protein [Lysobacter enzymogenes]|jgi:hypothetical protein|uniref:DUF6630 family protein n=1 Tax=Lysobacter enzymogenes TaxID=69 RepID=UPI000897B8E0|nr:hypothetical protein [Lysobacter enzymogenes]SDW07563.1 hypothetical protein SAMN05421681_10175 [Lysobacter enzymogenes]